MDLEEVRKNKKLTYEELAVLLGLPPTTVFRTCKKQGCIKLNTAHIIVKKLGGLVSYEDLLDSSEVC